MLAEIAIFISNIFTFFSGPELSKNHRNYTLRRNKAIKIKNVGNSSTLFRITGKLILDFSVRMSFCEIILKILADLIKDRCQETSSGAPDR